MALLYAILQTIAVLCAIWVIYDVIANRKDMSTGMKVLWVILALVFSIITAIIYYFVIYRKK